MGYDAVIAGASFAGLAVASRLRGRILLLDKKGIGEGQTSACALPLRTALRMGCGKAVLQEFEKITFHAKTCKATVRLQEPYCTVDYAKMCKTLFEKTRAQFKKEAVKGLEGGKVATSKRGYEARCIADCTGWRAALASSIEREYVKKSELTFGIETVAEYSSDEMHFFIDERLSEYPAWVFPAGSKCRIGMGSYTGQAKLLPKLKLFLKRLGAEAGETHCGFIPNRLRKPVVGKVFVVGDAAGQALPLSAEGIRKALEYGVACGDLMQEVIDEKLSLREALATYEKRASASKNGYALLGFLQRMLLKRYGLVSEAYVRLLRLAPNFLERNYLGI